MNELGLCYTAITAACLWNLKLVKNGYGCDQKEQFDEIVEEMAAIVSVHPNYTAEEVAEFYENHEY